MNEPEEFFLHHARYCEVCFNHGSDNCTTINPPEATERGSTMTNATIIPHSRDLAVTNIEALPRGVGARYMEVIHGPNGSFIAKQWRRKIPAASNGTFIDLGPRLALAEVR
jgi:hypothetical protein